MHGRHRKKAPRLLVFRGIAAVALALVIGVSSVATVMANTVSANVIDGNRSYTFNMHSADLAGILAQAEERGLVPLGPLDVAEQAENTTTVIIRRGVSLTVTESGSRRNLIAYRGDTVEKALSDNNILLRDEDEVTPARDTLIQAGLTVEIRRSCQVTMAADGERRKLTLVGATVADALAEAGIVLGEKDTINYPVTEPLFDNMLIRVGRIARLTVIADGETHEYEVAALTVRAALQQCGVAFSADDRLNVDLQAQPTDGMEIVITRVTTEEEKEIEEVDYPIQYLTSDEMYENQSEIRTYGEEGEKEVTYKLIYVEGELEGRVKVSEKIVKEPVPEVVVVGTKEREYSAITSVDGPGTFVDDSGNTVSYAYRIVGECTAYHPINPGDITATGVLAEYGCIAVDPELIPYGTRMYVVSPDGSVVYGYGTAVDTGGAAMDGDIVADLCYNTREECSIIGRRDMILYILY